MKGFMIIANGFEDNEALTTLDILKRSKIEIDAIALNSKNVLSQSGLNLVFEKSLNEANFQEYDFLVIPGGKAVSEVLRKDERVKEVITFFVKQKRLVATICAAPILVGELGYFENEKYTCFPGVESGIKNGKHINEKVVVSSNFITAKSMYYSIDFALAIIEYLQGKEKKEKVEASLKGEY